MSRRGKGRPPTPGAERLLKAREARRVVNEEMAAMSVPQLAEAQRRAATRLEITPRTLSKRLAVTPADPVSAAIDAALLKLATGASSESGLGAVLATLRQPLDPSEVVIRRLAKEEIAEFRAFLAAPLDFGNGVRRLTKKEIDEFAVTAIRVPDGNI